MTAAQIVWDTYRDSVTLTAPEAGLLREQLDKTEGAWRDCIEKALAADE